MDRSKCWGTTKVVISIEHCPSLKDQVGNILASLVHFAMKKTSLNSFGKVRISATEFEPKVYEE